MEIMPKQLRQFFD